MKVLYKSGSLERTGDVKEIYKLLEEETKQLIDQITSKKPQGRLLSKKHGYLVKNNVDHEAKSIIIEENGKIIFLKHLPDRVTDVKYLLHFYASSLDKMANILGSKNNILTVKQLISVFPELKVRRR